MEFLWQLFPILFTVMFLVVFATVLVTTFRGLSQWNKNNHSPRLTVPVTVVSKRQEMFRRRTRRARLHGSYTVYYATFQVESGDRMELQLDGSQYGLLVEGDAGMLTFQGTRFLDFRRT